MHGHLLADVLPIIGQVVSDLPVEFDLALLDELQRQHRRELLGYGSEPKLRIRRVWDIPLHIRHPKRALINHLPILRHQRRAIKLAIFVRQRQHLLNLRLPILGCCMLEDNEKKKGSGVKPQSAGC